MKKIFILGAVSNTSVEEQRKFSIYENCLRKLFPKVDIVSPDTIWTFRENYIKNYPNADISKINKEMVDFDLQQVRESDLCVCDLSISSTGMGIELGTLLAKNCQNVIFLARKDSIISNMILGAFPNKNVYYYKDFDEIEEILSKIFLK